MVVEVRSTFKVGVPNRSNPPHFYGQVAELVRRGIKLIGSV